jgi:hypothetical protein
LNHCAEEAKLKSEAKITTTGNDVFEGTFKAPIVKFGDDETELDPAPPSPEEGTLLDSDDDASAPPDPIDPSKCSTARLGIIGSSAGVSCDLHHHSQGMAIPCLPCYGGWRG